LLKALARAAGEIRRRGKRKRRRKVYSPRVARVDVYFIVNNNRVTVEDFLRITSRKVLQLQNEEKEMDARWKSEKSNTIIPQNTA